MHKIDDPNAPAEAEIDFETFRKIDIRIGTVLEAEPLEGARKPAYKLIIDFGEGLGTKKTSVQITEHYMPEDLLGRQVMAVVNFPPRQIGKFMSQVLTLGFPDTEGKIILGQPAAHVPNGARLV